MASEEMMGRTPDALSGVEDIDKPMFISDEGTSSDGQETIEAYTLALPPEEVEKSRKAHNEVLHSLTCPPQGKERLKMSPLRRFLQACSNLPRLAPNSIPMQVRYENLFQCTIDVEVMNERSNPIIRKGIAIIDFWSHCNIMSRKFGNLVSDGLESARPYPCVNTLKGKVNAIKKIEARWYCRNISPNQRFRFDPTMLSSQFEIMEHGEDFDVIIGAPDIIKYDILNLGWRVPLIATNRFRSLPLPVNARSVVSEENAAALARQRELEEMARDETYRKYRREYAHTQAHHCAMDYANRQVNLFGPQVFRKAYDEEYARTFAAAERQYTETHPRY